MVHLYPAHSRFDQQTGYSPVTRYNHLTHAASAILDLPKDFGKLQASTGRSTYAGKSLQHNNEKDAFAEESGIIKDSMRSGANASGSRHVLLDAHSDSLRSDSGHNSHVRTPSENIRHNAESLVGQTQDSQSRPVSYNTRLSLDQNPVQHDSMDSTQAVSYVGCTVSVLPEMSGKVTYCMATRGFARRPGLMDFVTPWTVGPRMSHGRDHHGSRKATDPIDPEASARVNHSSQEFDSNAQLYIPTSQSETSGRPDHSDLNEASKSRDYILSGELHLPQNQLDFAATHVSEHGRFSILGSSKQVSINTDTHTPPNHLVLSYQKQSAQKYALDASLSFSDMLVGLSACKHWTRRRRKGGLALGSVDDASDADLKRRKLFFSAGAEVYAALKGRSGGCSLGARVISSPPTIRQGSIYTQGQTVSTLILNPLMGHLSTAHVAYLFSNMALASRFDFNFFSWDSNLAFGMQLWSFNQSWSLSAKVDATKQLVGALHMKLHHTLLSLHTVLNTGKLGLSLETLG